MISFIFKKISDCMEPSQPAFTIPSQVVSMIAHFHKMPMQEDQPIKGDRMLFLAFTYLGILQKKIINMEAVNMSKSEPIICLNS